jgi:nucleoside-diphosphate-sugar epimerase
MNLFVTGGTGYLGSAVTAALLADGHKVRAHVRSIASADRLPAGVEPVAGDLGDAAWLRARIDESDGVVHAASPNDATGGSFDAAFLDVALSALAGSDRPLVYTGGIWVHGSGDPITEESPSRRCCTSATANSASPTFTATTSPRSTRSACAQRRPGPTTWAPTRTARQ